MYENDFPGLVLDSFTIESPKTITYNCIAWAASASTKWWWPDDYSYWPINLPLNDDIETFKQLFSQLGYSVCSNEDIEEGFEKVAIYAVGNNVKHAARQLTTGRWTSKLGRDHDIEHSPSGLEGKEYGKVVSIMRRPITTQP